MKERKRNFDTKAKRKPLPSTNHRTKPKRVSLDDAQGATDSDNNSEQSISKGVEITQAPILNSCVLSYTVVKDTSLIQQVASIISLDGVSPFIQLNDNHVSTSLQQMIDSIDYDTDILLPEDLYDSDDAILDVSADSSEKGGIEII